MQLLQHAQNPFWVLGEYLRVLSELLQVLGELLQRILSLLWFLGELHWRALTLLWGICKLHWRKPFSEPFLFLTWNGGYIIFITVLKLLYPEEHGTLIGVVLLTPTAYCVWEDLQVRKKRLERVKREATLREMHAKFTEALEREDFPEALKLLEDPKFVASSALVSSSLPKLNEQCTEHGILHDALLRRYNISYDFIPLVVNLSQKISPELLERTLSHPNLLEDVRRFHRTVPNVFPWSFGCTSSMVKR